MLDGMTTQRTANFVADKYPRISFDTVQSHLDQIMRLQGKVDFTHHAGRRTLGSNGNHRLQMMGLCTQGAAPFARQRRGGGSGVVHCGILP